MRLENSLPLRFGSRDRDRMALVAALLLAFTGCRIPALCGPLAGPELPTDYLGATSPENSADMGIEEFFNDPVLTQLIVQGLSQNQELRIRNQEVLIAENEILARRGAYLPFVSLGAAQGVERPSLFTPLGAAEDQLTYPGGRRFPDPLGNTQMSANLFWQVDIWRQLRNARDAAIERYCAAIEARDYLITRIVADIADNYYELASLDQRLVYINQTIELQQQSLEVAKFQKEAARGTELGVQRFLAEVRKNESQRLIIKQRIIEVENQINFLAGRYPQAVEREQWDFIKLDSRILQVGVPSQLLLNRRDIRAAEHEVAASGLDVLVARADFFPRLDITAGVGFEAFNPRYLFDPGAFIANAAGELMVPVINRKAIQAQYMNANARQLQAIYEYQRTVLNAYTEVVNRVTKAANYRASVEIKLGQVTALEESVTVATDLFQGARPEVEYMDVLFAQRDLLEARTVLIETKQQQLSAIVNAYQALGGGVMQFVDAGTIEDNFEVPTELQPGDQEMDQPAPRIPPVPPAPVENGRLEKNSPKRDGNGRISLAEATKPGTIKASRASPVRDRGEPASPSVIQQIRGMWTTEKPQFAEVDAVDEPSDKDVGNSRPKTAGKSGVRQIPVDTYSEDE